MSLSELNRGLLALVLGLTLAGTAQAHGENHDAHAAAQGRESEAKEATRVDLRNRTLVTQDGEEVQFVTDVIADRIVVMDFVFTTCTNVCPILSAVLSQVQSRLGDRAGDQVGIISVTVDPVTDTPERLKAYAAKHNAGEGWVWLTGPKSTVDDVLNGLGAYSVDFEDHPSMVLVGDGRTGEWSRFFGFPSPDRIMKQVNAYQAARQAASGGES